MKSIAKSLVAGALTSLALTASAANPGFVQARASLNDADQLQVCFKETGLGANQLINFEATADATATYACVTSTSSGEIVKGARPCPTASQTITVDGKVIGTAEYSSGLNGGINQCLVVEDNPVPRGSFKCPEGQTLTLLSLSYKNILITDVTNNLSMSTTPSEFSATTYTCAKQAANVRPIGGGGQ